jgi:hypothetical protein
MEAGLFSLLDKLEKNVVDYDKDLLLARERKEEAIKELKLLEKAQNDIYQTMETEKASISYLKDVTEGDFLPDEVSEYNEKKMDEVYSNSFVQQIEFKPIKFYNQKDATHEHVDHGGYKDYYYPCEDRECLKRGPVMDIDGFREKDHYFDIDHFSLTWDESSKKETPKYYLKSCYYDMWWQGYKTINIQKVDSEVINSLIKKFVIVKLVVHENNEDWSVKGNKKTEPRIFDISDSLMKFSTDN